MIDFDIYQNFVLFLMMFTFFSSNIIKNCDKSFGTFRFCFISVVLGNFWLFGNCNTLEQGRGNIISAFHRITSLIADVTNGYCHTSSPQHCW